MRKHILTKRSQRRAKRKFQNDDRREKNNANNRHSSHSHQRIDLARISELVKEDRINTQARISKMLASYAQNSSW